jgi:hypothetical protein
MRLSYNDIVFLDTHLLTTRYEEEPQYHVNGEYLYTTFTIGIRGLVSSDAPLFSAATIGAPTPVKQMKDVRNFLLTPGKKLLFADHNGNILLQSPRPGDLADDTKGPRTRVSVSSFSKETFIIDFEVTTDLACPQAYMPLIHNSWSVDVSYDQNAYATYEISGQLVISGARQPERILHNTDFLLPPVAKGFVRQNFRYTTDRTGLTINYSASDRQVKVVPPKPATVASGSFTEGLSANAIMAEVDVHLEGAKDVPRSALVHLANKIAVVYLMPPEKTELGEEVEGGSTRISLFENSVDLRIRVLREKKDEMVAQTGLFDIQMADLLDQQETRQPGPHGTYLVRTLHPRLKQGICVPPTRLGNTEAQEQPEPDQRQDDIQTIQEAPEQLEIQKRTFVSQDSHKFTDYRIESTYVQKVGIFGFPAAADATGEPVATTIIQAHSPLWYRIVKWQAEKMGDTPLIPNPVTKDSNEVLIYESLSPSAPHMRPSSDSEITFIRGVYIYLLKLAPSKFKSGKIPWMQTQNAFGVVLGKDFSDDIIDNTPAKPTQ